MVGALITLGVGSPVIWPLVLNFNPGGNEGLIVRVTVPAPPLAVTGIKDTACWPVTNTIGNVTVVDSVVVTIGGVGADDTIRLKVFELVCGVDAESVAVIV